MRSLIIVHVEPDFSESGGTEQLARKIARYAKDFDAVINVTCNQQLSNSGGYEVLSKFSEEEWIWGYWPGEIDEEGCDENGNVQNSDFISVTTQDWAMIEPWMKQLPKEHSYTLVGGARYECLQSVYEIFQHLNLKTKVNDKYCYAL